MRIHRAWGVSNIASGALSALCMCYRSLRVIRFGFITGPSQCRYCLYVGTGYTAVSPNDDKKNQCTCRLSVEQQYWMPRTARPPCVVLSVAYRFGQDNHAVRGHQRRE